MPIGYLPGWARDEPPDQTWRAQAACRTLDSSHWYPEDGQTAPFAKSVCRECPVRLPCLDFAIATKERHGIWGGMSERERRNEVRNRRRRAAAKRPGAPETRRCTSCGLDRAIEEFSENKPGLLRGNCKRCQLDYQRDRRAKLRDERQAPRREGAA